MANSDFKWITTDIDSTLVFKVISNNSSNSIDYGTYCVQDVLESDWDKLNIRVANIDDLTNLLTLGIVRFVNIVDKEDIIDIPLRKLYSLYKKANVLCDNNTKNLMSFRDLETFSIIDGKVRDNLLIRAFVVNDISEDLSEFMKIASEFEYYGLQQKFDALTRVMYINHKRLIGEENNKSYK